MGVLRSNVAAKSCILAVLVAIGSGCGPRPTAINACNYLDSFQAKTFGNINSGPQIPLGRVLAFDPVSKNAGPAELITTTDSDLAPSPPKSTTTDSVTVKLTASAKAKLPSTVSAVELESALSNAFKMTVTNYTTKSIANIDSQINASAQKTALANRLKSQANLKFAYVYSLGLGDHLEITSSTGSSNSGTIATLPGAKGEIKVTYDCESTIDQKAQQGLLFFKIVGLRLDSTQSGIVTDVAITPNVADYNLQNAAIQ